MQLLAPRYLFLEPIQGAYWVQNGKNDGFTKMSVESWKLYSVVRFVSMNNETITIRNQQGIDDLSNYREGIKNNVILISLICQNIILRFDFEI